MVDRDMTDQAENDPSSSRPARVPPQSSRTDLLHTIVQLREQRNFSSSQKRTDNHQLAVGASDSVSSGRHRLRKVGSNGVRKDSPIQRFNDDIEDWDDEEDLETEGSAAALSESLDKLSIVTKPVDIKEGTQKPRAKIMDSLGFLNEARKLSASAISSRQTIVVENVESPDVNVKKSTDVINAHDEKRFSRGDCNEMFLPSKPNSMVKSHGAFARKPVQGEICWDLEDEKENSGAETVIFVHNKSVFKLPLRIANILYPHQHEGIKWLWGLHIKGMGGILGDDMGLGKTMQIAAFFLGLFAADLIKHALIVAPKTLVAHWVKELSFVGLGRKTKDYSTTSASQRQYALQHVLQSGGILLTTYDVVRNNWQALRGDFHGRDGFGDTSEDILTWDYMILDEGHLIKNPSTQRAKSLKEIPCGHRIVLSGTPIQNNLREMWALFDFCCPELLGDRKEFKARYEDSILSANSKDSTDRQKRIGSTVAQDLRKRIAPFFLRRLKSEVLSSTGDTTSYKLSRKTDIIVWLRLTKCQRELYTAFLESKTAHQSLEGSALAALTVLKKICDHPSLLTQRAADDIAEGMESMLNTADTAEVEAMSASVAKVLEADESLAESQGALSCKMAFIVVLLEKLIDEGHRTLVFAQTRKMLDMIEREVVKKHYRYRRIDGTMKASDRERYVQEYQNSSSIPIFLLTSKVGGLGLTLTAADRVIIVDPAWNPSTDNQSVDRAYRIGQRKDVIIYRLMTSGTIEEKIYRKQVFKGGLFKVATEHKEQFRYFSHQELRELLTLPKTGFDISVTQQQLHEEHSKQYQRDELLETHILFLESQNIAGVSHHDLLFSKQAPELPAAEDEMHWRHGPSGPRPDILSIPPKEWTRTTSAKDNEMESKDALIQRQKLEVSANISRLSHTLSDQVLISKLPDKGSNLKNKLEDLKNQLKNLEYLSVLEREGAPSAPIVIKEETCEVQDVASILAGLKM